MFFKTLDVLISKCLNVLISKCLDGNLAVSSPLRAKPVSRSCRLHNSRPFSYDRDDDDGDDGEDEDDGDEGGH